MQPNNTTRLQVPIIMGDSYLDPITCQESRVSSFRLIENSSDDDSSGPTVVPFCGGYQAYLDADVMATEKRMLEALRDFKDTLNGNEMLFFFGVLQPLFLGNQCFRTSDAIRLNSMQPTDKVHDNNSYLKFELVALILSFFSKFFFNYAFIRK